ncbi:MAG: glycosyltransferase family 2 protein [Candidatus Moranbacteria bacterium]|nr:glycosyltransferase family 2 protein [Candidatus Moranbacteria bacterium]
MNPIDRHDAHAGGPEPTLTVIVPAYNEEANVGAVVRGILAQQEDGFALARLIVASDGSTDGTVAVAESAAGGDARVTVVNDGNRLGKALRLNRELENVPSDIVAILDADIAFEHERVLAELLAPMIRHANIIHVSGSALPLAPETLVERIAYAGAMLWEIVRRSPSATPLYRSEGRIHAYRKTMYLKLRFPETSADEAYSFLFGEHEGFPFAVSDGALVRYRLPSTFRDYVLQMRRFLKSEEIQARTFGEAFVSRYYTITLADKFRGLATNLVADPVHTILYALLIPLPRILKAFDSRNGEHRWADVPSTKRLLSR